MIKTFTGPMHSGKSAHMLKKYKKIFNKEHILTFKPRKDIRDGEFIISKDFEEKIPAILIDDLSEILNVVNDNTRIIFIDEAQLLTGNVNVLTYLSVFKDIDIFISGLNMTSEQNPFLIMPQILAISDEVINISASCYDCGRKASYTYFIGEKNDSILVGDEGYIPLCSRCLVSRRNDNGIKLILRNDDKN